MLLVFLKPMRSNISRHESSITRTPREQRSAKTITYVNVQAIRRLFPDQPHRLQPTKRRQLHDHPTVAGRLAMTVGLLQLCVGS